MEIHFYLPQLPRSTHSFIDSARNITRWCSAYNTFSHCSRHSIFFINFFLIILSFCCMMCGPAVYTVLLPSQINLYQKKNNLLLNNFFLFCECVFIIFFSFFGIVSCAQSQNQYPTTIEQRKSCRKKKPLKKIRTHNSLGSRHYIRCI